MVRRDDAVFAVDLWLDVLVGADGITHSIYDQAGLEEALARGWLSEREASGARAGLRELIGLIKTGDLVRFLGGLRPFSPASVPEAPDMRRVPVTEVEETLSPGVRPSW